MLPLVVLGAWLLTASLGARELIGWRRSGDSPPAVVYRHLTTALSGLLVWLAFLATASALLAWLAFAVLFLNNNLGEKVLISGWRSRHPSLADGSWREHLAANWEIVRFGRSPGVTAHAWLAGFTFFAVLGTAIASL